MPGYLFSIPVFLASVSQTYVIPRKTGIALISMFGEINLPTEKWKKQTKPSKQKHQDDSGMTERKGGLSH